MGKVSILIPSFNEQTYIERCLEKVFHALTDGWEKEIIVIDDGSTDNTSKLLREFSGSENPLKIITLPSNSGKGAALQAAIQVATGDVMIVQDADLEYDPEDYRAILKEYDNPATSVVYGSRILGEKAFNLKHGNLFFYVGGLTLTRIINIFFGTKLTDQPTGYKSWRSSLNGGLLKQCHATGFEFEIEMTAYFSKIGTIREVPIHYYPRSIRGGKKLGPADFFRSVGAAIRCRYF